MTTSDDDNRREDSWEREEGHGYYIRLEQMRDPNDQLADFFRDSVVQIQSDPDKIISFTGNNVPMKLLYNPEHKRTLVELKADEGVKWEDASEVVDMYIIKFQVALGIR